MKTVEGIHLPKYLCKHNKLGVTSCAWKFVSNWPRWSEIADFQSLRS